MLLYRVFPYLADASPDNPGGALYVPRQGAGRIDNPDLYNVRYFSAAAAGAVAEVFGWRAQWSANMLRGVPRLPGSVYALATLEMRDAPGVCNLDDAHELLARGMRPSTVITRELRITQGWARSIFAEQRWDGIGWWSYYDARWMSCGIWESEFLMVHDVQILRMQDVAVVTTARTLRRAIVLASPAGS